MLSSYRGADILVCGPTRPTAISTLSKVSNSEARRQTLKTSGCPFHTPTKTRSQPPPIYFAIDP